MTVSIDWAVAWLMAVSITACAVAVWDKSCACRRQWRVPERVLWLVSVAGGSAAMWLTFLLVRHKTTRPGFLWGLPLLAVAQGAVLYGAIYTGYFMFV